MRRAMLKGQLLIFARFRAIFIYHSLYHGSVRHVQFLYGSCIVIFVFSVSMLCQHCFRSIFAIFRGFVFVRACTCSIVVSCASRLVHFVVCHVACMDGYFSRNASLQQAATWAKWSGREFVCTDVGIRDFVCIVHTE